MLPRLSHGQRVSRRRVDGAWLVSVELAAGSALAMAVETGAAGRRHTELHGPVPVLVHRRDLVDLDLLRRLQDQGLIVMRETR